MDNVIDFLKQLDLSDIEAKLYLTLLQSGPTSVRDLAATTDIKRTTAYFYIDQLVEKGLIMKLVRGSKKLVAANEPESLEQLVKKKLASATQAETQFAEIERLIAAHIPSDIENNSSEIRFYKSKSGVKKIYDEALRSPELRMYANLTELEQLMMPNSLGFDYTLFENALAKNPKLQIFEIIADTPGTVEQFTLDDTAQSTQRYFFKFMPAKVGLSSPGILLYDNKVAIVNGKGELGMTVLQNNDYAENSKRLFDFIWGVLPDKTSH